MPNKKLRDYIVYQDEYVELYNCDSRLLKDDDRYFDLVFADPPFSMDLTDFEFLLFDFDRIKGHSFLMSNERHLAKYIVKYDIYFRRLFCVDIVVANFLNSRMPMQQTDFIAEFRKLGAENNKFVNCNDCFSTLIVAHKDRRKGKNKSQNVDKAKKLFYDIITHYSNEGDTLLDPFTGSGKMLLCARELKRKAVGFEISKESAQSAKEMLLQRELFE